MRTWHEYALSSSRPRPTKYKQSAIRPHDRRRNGRRRNKRRKSIRLVFAPKNYFKSDRRGEGEGASSRVNVFRFVARDEIGELRSILISMKAGKRGGKKGENAKKLKRRYLEQWRRIDVRVAETRLFGFTYSMRIPDSRLRRPIDATRRFVFGRCGAVSADFSLQRLQPSSHKRMYYPLIHAEYIADECLAQNMYDRTYVHVHTRTAGYYAYSGAVRKRFIFLIRRRPNRIKARNYEYYAAYAYTRTRIRVLN